MNLTNNSSPIKLAIFHKMFPCLSNFCRKFEIPAWPTL